MGQRFGDPSASQTALEPALQVEIELVVVSHPGDCGDGDQASIRSAEIDRRQRLPNTTSLVNRHELRRDASKFFGHSLGPCGV